MPRIESEDDGRLEVFAHRDEQRFLAIEETRQFIGEQMQALVSSGAHDAEGSLFTQLLTQLDQPNANPYNIKKQAQGIVARRALDH